MPRLTDEQLLDIIDCTDMRRGWTQRWDRLTPKQRQRAEMLAERRDNHEEVMDEKVLDKTGVQFR